MNKKSIKKYAAISLSLFMLVNLTSCSLFNKKKDVSLSDGKINQNVTKELKKDDSMQNIEIREKDNNVAATVLLEKNVDSKKQDQVTQKLVNDLKNKYKDKEVNVLVVKDKKTVSDIKIKESEVINNKVDEKKLFFIITPKYIDALQSIAARVNNLDLVDSVEIYLDNEKLNVNEKDIRKIENETIAVRNIPNKFKEGKIVIKSKNGQEIVSNF